MHDFGNTENVVALTREIQLEKLPLNRDKLFVWVVKARKRNDTIICTSRGYS